MQYEGALTGCTKYQRDNTLNTVWPLWLCAWTTAKGFREISTLCGFGLATIANNACHKILCNLSLSIWSSCSHLFPLNSQPETADDCPRSAVGLFLLKMSSSSPPLLNAWSYGIIWLLELSLWYLVGPFCRLLLLWHDTRELKLNLKVE